MNTPLPNSLPFFFLHFLRKQPWRFAILFGSTVAHTLESNVLPYALKLMVDATIRLGDKTAGAFQELVLPIALFLGMWTLMIVIWRMQEAVYAKALPQLRADIRMSLFDYAQGHSHAYFSNHFAGTIAGKISDLPRAAHALVEMTRWRLLSVVWVAIVAVIWLGTVSPYFSLVLAGWIVIHMAISYGFARRIAVYSDKHAEDENILKGQIIDVITNYATTRLFARRAYEMQHIGKYQRIEQESNFRSNIAMLKARIAIDIPLILMYAIMLWLLVSGWQAGWVSAGDIVFVMFTVFNVMGLTWMLGTELPQFFSEIGVCRQALTLINRPHDITDAPGAPPLRVTHGEIVFESVHFHYMPGKDIFRGKNITIRAGEKVGLVGFSGSGKSTFVNLILRLYDVESGRILIDGQNIAQVTQDSLHEAIAMIPQDATLFHRTLAENIRYGKPEASDAEVIDASKRAHCHDYIMQLPEGYGALVGERGVKLSGGQRQRIAIARAVLKNAPILILDEATSALDSVTEHCIQQSLSSLMDGRTAIVIAHRLSTLSHVDRILVFKEGEIVESGSHAELLALGGHYALLWNMQADGFLPDENTH